VSEFAVVVHQNEFLAEGTQEVHAIVTVSSDVASVAAPATSLASASTERRAIIVMGDCSGSMEDPLDRHARRPVRRMAAARNALAAAVNQITDGTDFAVIAGNDHGEVIYPPAGGLAVASAETRLKAIDAVKRLHAGGGTAISTWLSASRALVANHPSTIRLGILVTDGKNEGESADALARELQACQGVLQCDCRGVGDDWDVAELRGIATALLGDVDMIRDPEQMEADFRSLIESAVGKNVGDVGLRVWTPKGAEVVFLKQVSPSIDDLTVRAAPVSELIRHFPIGAWGREERDYHVCVRVKPGAVGDEMLAARVSLMVGDENVGQAIVRAVWTDDVSLSTRIVPEVAHYTGQADLANAIQEGLAARSAGDTRTATVKLGEAVRLATEAGHTGTVKLLEKVVDVDDPATGTVRLKASVDKGDEMELDTRSTKTVRVRKES